MLSQLNFREAIRRLNSCVEVHTKYHISRPSDFLKEVHIRNRNIQKAQSHNTAKNSREESRELVKFEQS